MNKQKKSNNLEIVLGLMIIIVLALIALALLIKREIGYRQVKTAVWEKEITVSNMQESKAETVKYEETEEVENIEDIDPLPLYQILGKEKYRPASLTERKQEDHQLKELYEYWDAYKMDAVDELVRLERLQAVSAELTGKNKFYYYGSVDALGRPSGKGLAVYENNTYYFGEWKEGLRHGKGVWLEVAIYTEENQGKNLGVLEHRYNGEWSKDLPNGQGHEHFSYDYSILKEENIKRNECIANAIGGFKDGYYHGEMYIMTANVHGRIKEWNAVCDRGVWVPFMKGNTTDAVFESYEKDEHGNNEYHYIFPEDNKFYGIIGLKK